MSKKIKVKLLSCASIEEMKKIMLNKRIIGYSQTGGGINPCYINMPENEKKPYDFIDEMILVLQDDNGEIFALQISPVSYWYEAELLFESKHKGKKLEAYQKKSLKESLDCVNDYVPKNGVKWSDYPDEFLSMRLTPFNGDIGDVDTAFYNIKGNTLYSKDEIIVDNFDK